MTSDNKKWNDVVFCCLRAGEELLSSLKSLITPIRNLEEQHQQTSPLEGKGPGKGHKHFVSMCKAEQQVWRKQMC